ncbi:hypothetical protein BDV06DRAFT_218431 [Aspergillus oleicola]
MKAVGNAEGIALLQKLNSLGDTLKDHDRLLGEHQAELRSQERLLELQRDDLKSQKQHLYERDSRMEAQERLLELQRDDLKSQEQHLYERDSRMEAQERLLEEQRENGKAQERLISAHRGEIMQLQKDNRHAAIVRREIRACALDDLAEKELDRDIRNGYVHCGYVLGDIDLLSHLDEHSERGKVWKKVFKQIYTITFETCRARNVQYDEDDRIVEIMNINANVEVLDRWNTGENRERAQHIQACCLKVIEQWAIKRDDLFMEGSISLQSYQKAMAAYYH